MTPDAGSTDRESRPAVPFDPPLAAASLSGHSDADWARAAAPAVGCAILGGIAIDAPTRDAARRMVERDREEFLPPDPVAFVEDQLARVEGLPLRAGVNVRTTTTAPLQAVAERCADHDAICEINAHCRQDEMCATGAGEPLLRDPGRLGRYVSAAAETGAPVSVKVRAECDGTDLVRVTRTAVEAGATFVHVDAMDSEAVIERVAAAAGDDAWVIANNGVRDRATVREYREYGADAVSVGRPSDDPAALRRVHRAVGAEWDGSGAGDRIDPTRTGVADATR